MQSAACFAEGAVAKGRILVVGDVMTDIIVRPEGPMILGSDRRAKIEHHQGGSAANQAAWLASLGANVCFVAKVGSADLEAQTTSFRQAGVLPFLVPHHSLHTGRLVTIVGENGQRSFFTDRGANDSLDEVDLPSSLLDGVSILHVSAYSLFEPRPRAAVASLIRRAQDLSILVSVDPGSAGFIADAGAQAFLEWTSGAGIFFPNEDEALALTGTADIAEQSKILSAHFPLVVFKRGSAGAEVHGRDASALASADAPRTDAVDTTGAGDAFLAGFLSTLLLGKGIHDALQAAVASGSLATTQVGGRPMPNTGSR